MRTRDRPLMLARAIGSVIAQTYRCWELVIVNDAGDPEPVEELVRLHRTSAAGTIRVLHRDRSTGMEAASNAGIAQSSGDYVAIHDDDDSWEPEFLEVCVGHLERSAAPDVQGVVTHAVRVNERIRDGVIETLSRRPWNPWLKFVSLFDMAQGNLFPPISFVFRRKVLGVIGGYREDLPVLGDWEFNLRFLSHFAIDVIPRPLANYHLRSEVMEGIYSNTVVAARDLHERVGWRIRDELMRRDLQTGRFGLGFLMAMGCLPAAKGSGIGQAAIRERRAELLMRLGVRLQRAGVRDLLVYGAGEVGKQFAEVAEALGLHIAQFVDSNERLWGTTVGGIRVGSLADAVQKGINRYVVASFAFAEEIEETIRKFYAERGLGEPEIYCAWE
jgi:glycosyltransferase involved in cell wall biosynthesis